MKINLLTIILTFTLVVIGTGLTVSSTHAKPLDYCDGFQNPPVPSLAKEPFVSHPISYSRYFIPGVAADWDGDGDLDLQYAENLGGFNFRYISAIDDLVTSESGAILSRNARQRQEVYRTVQEQILSGTYYNFHGVAAFNFGDNLPSFILAPYYNQGIPIMMLRNMGSWRFESVFGDYLRNLLGWTPNSVWFSETIGVGDLTGDGLNDIYVPFGHAAEPYQSAFLRNTGNGFVEEALLRGIGIPNLPVTERPEGTQIVDIDDDGDLDLFVSHFLFINDGTGNFIDARESYSLPYLTADEGIALVDYDNDGLLDLYVRSGYTDKQLFRNTGAGFVNTSVTSGLACLTQNLGYFWGDSWADMNNDGYMDLVYISDYPSNPRYNIYLNQKNGTFLLGYTGNRFLHLSGTADFDMDGDLDVFALGEVDENQLPKSGDTTTLAIVPVDNQGRQNEHGATVRVKNSCNAQIQTRVIGSNHVYLPQGQYEAHFAVPTNCTYEIDVIFVKRTEEGKQVMTIPYNPTFEKALRIIVTRNSYTKRLYSGYQYLFPFVSKNN
jgi:hypothetical protein